MEIKPVEIKPLEIKTPTNEEGVVVGSFFVTVRDFETGDDGKTGWFKQPLSKNMSYGFNFKSIDNLLISMFGFSTYLNVIPEKETFFVRKLSPGRYVFENIKLADTIIPFSQYFNVEAGKTTYIGKFQLNMPARVGAGSKFSTSRTNSIEDARSAVAGDHPEVAKNLILTKDYLKP